MAEEKVNPFTGKSTTLKKDWHTNMLDRYELKNGEIIDRTNGNEVKESDLLKRLNAANNAAVEAMREYQQIAYSVYQHLKGGDVIEEFNAFPLRQPKVVRAYEEYIY